jgi:predicted enzyme related to lactoylglutathione lyase
VLVHHKDHQGKYELGTGFSRVGFRLPDVRAVVNAARAAGYPVTREPMAAQGAILGFITDPDGYALELVQMP